MDVKELRLKLAQATWPGVNITLENDKIYFHQEMQRKSPTGSKEEKEHKQARDYWISVRKGN